MDDMDQTDLTTLTVDLLSAYFASNSVPSENLAGLIQSTRAALAEISNPAPVEPEAPAYVPAVSIRKSLASRDHIISMIDGKPYKTLKRHLASKGMTPAEYRARYKLPADYPTVAPAYSEQRRAVAEKLGLGRARRATPAPQTAASMATPAVGAHVAADNFAATKSVKPAKPRAVPVKAVSKTKPVAALVKAPNPGKAKAPAKGKPNGAASENAPAATLPEAPVTKAAKRKLSIAPPKPTETTVKTAAEQKAGSVSRDDEGS